MEIEVIYMDITKLGKRVDAIVNAANETLLGGGGVDGAIHRAAGPELVRECATLGGCRPGEVKATKAYRLENKYIIHTVGPRYYSDPNPEKTLSRCYENCLKLADELGVESIAFPCISIGVFGYPVEEASKICAKVLCGYKPTSLKRIIICVFGDFAALDYYQSAIEASR